jgi:hypothetical protein
LTRHPDDERNAPYFKRSESWATDRDAYASISSGVGKLRHGRGHSKQ